MTAARRKHGPPSAQRKRLPIIPGTPAWTLGGVEQLALVAIPEKVRRVTVYGDRGSAAERLFANSREYLSADGR